MLTSVAASRRSALLGVEAVGCRPFVSDDGHGGTHALEDAEVDVGVDDFREGGAWGHGEVSAVQGYKRVQPWC